MGTSRGRWVIVGAVLGSGMVMLDGTVVNVALPRIGADLGASMAALQWILTAYLVTLSGLILLGGSLGDRYGRRRVFLTGVIWFAAASALCGLAPGTGVLIAARALQGFGGALLTPGSLAIIQATFHPDDRAAAVGAWSGLGGVAGAVGPLLGGWLAGGPGWRWVFLINVPVALVVLAVSLRRVPESRDEAATGAFDLWGAVLAALALGGVTYALTAAGSGRLTAAIWLLGIAGLLAGGVFGAVERRRAAPMLPPELFRSRLFTAVNAVTVCVYGAFGGVLLLLMVQLQTVAGFSPLVAGLAMLPATALLLALSPRAARLGEAIGARLPLTVGPVVAAGGVLLMLRIGAHASYWRDVLPATAVLGIGLTMLVAPLTATVLASVDVRRAGIASGVNNAAARVAGLLAVAALPLVVGLSGDGYRVPAQVDHSFRGAMVICAAVLAAGGGLAWLTVRGGRPAPEPEHPVAEPQCVWSCGAPAPPLDPGEPSARQGPP
ncbi:MFS transporter [Streptomyces humicola]|nr:MFS transporter [Streptomyces humicola]